ncbi:MAG: fibronectin type III domain-containing protein [Halococcoides sp.]
MSSQPNESDASTDESTRSDDDFAADRRTFLKLAGSTTVAGTVGTSMLGGASAQQSSQFGVDSGFADTSWFDDSVQVITISDLTQSTVQSAFETSGPRLIVFEESGVVDLGGGSIEISEPNCWVAGQTAPSPGVTFINGMFQVSANDCVVQHIRILRGETGGAAEGADPMNNGDGTQNVVFDHCSSFWGQDENLSVGYDSDRTTLVNCLIAEGLDEPEENSCGTLVGDGATNVAILGNVYARNNDRNPRLKDNTETAVVNNLVYYFDKAIMQSSGALSTVVGNVYLGRFDWSDAIIKADGDGGETYLADNRVADPGLNGRTFCSVPEVSSRPLWPSGLSPLSSGAVESHNLPNAGARPADRISHERRVIDAVANRADPTEGVDAANAPGIPGSESEVGGYPDHGSSRHSLSVPDSGLRDWLARQSAAVEPGGSSTITDHTTTAGEDGTAPTSPSNLRSTGRTSTSVDIAWDPASDAGGSGLDHYRITVDGSEETTVAAGTTTATISGLSSNTEYSIGVVAVDGAGNRSAPASLTVTTREDTTGDASGAGAHFGVDAGFADTSWLESSDVQVIRVQEATRSAVEAAFTASGPRVVVFETSGVIDLNWSGIQITNDKCWVAGQTAPSPGITFIRGELKVNASDCVVQHIRFFRGQNTGGGEGKDAINTADQTTNNVIDHVTSCWGRDENLTVGYNTDRTTFTNCLVAEGLDDPEENSNGTLVGDGATNVAIMGTVYAKNNDRNPRLKNETRTVIVNTLAYQFDEAVNADNDARAAAVGNKYVSAMDPDNPIFENGYLYLEDNVMGESGLEGSTQIADVDPLDTKPLWPDGLQALSSGTVESHNLGYAGARPADRIDHEKRIIDDVRNRTGSIPGGQGEVGGFPSHGSASHALTPPDTGLRKWLERWALAVEEPDVAPPNGGSNTTTTPDEPTWPSDATDPNGDGLYEDLSGDGAINFPDVNMLFQNSDTANVRTNAQFYDFESSGTINLQDVMALFQMV